MKKIINCYLTYMIKNEKILQEEIEIYRFGLECMVLKVIHILSYLVIAIMMSEVFELLLMLIVLISLRKSAGGYHAKTEVGCYMISCTAVCLGLLFHKVVSHSSIYIISWIVSSFVIFLLAPIDNANKRMDCDEKDYYKKATRKGVLIIGIMVALFGIIRIEKVAEMLIIGMIILTISLLVEKFHTQQQAG